MPNRRGPGRLPSLGTGTALCDQQRWDALVESNAQRVWNIARGRGLDADEAFELFQLVWLRLADHVEDIAADDQISEWVCAAADREARLAMARQRPVPTAAGRPDASLGLVGA